MESEQLLALKSGDKITFAIYDDLRKTLILGTVFLDYARHRYVLKRFSAKYDIEKKALILLTIDLESLWL